MKLNIPGEGAKTLLDDRTRNLDFFSQKFWEPFDLNPYDKSTKTFNDQAIGRVTKDYWVVTCINPRRPISGDSHTIDDFAFDGYIAISPNGVRYKMDKKVVFGAKDFFFYSNGEEAVVHRKAAKYFVTEVTDVHGNWVKYDYSSDGKLERIWSNDGRTITLNYYYTTKLVKSVTANNRTWVYTYRTLYNSHNSNSIENALYRVVQPDGKYWEFELQYSMVEKLRSNSCGVSQSPYGGYASYVKHPYGMRADYGIASLCHVRKLSRGSFPGSLSKSYIKSLGVVSKVLSGPSVPTSSWIYDYEQFNSSSDFKDSPTKKTTIIDPSGNKTVHHIYKSEERSHSDSPLVGRIHKTQKYDSYNTLLEEVENTYLIGDPVGTESVLSYLHSVPTITTPVYKIKTSQNRGGDIFTKEYVFDLDADASSYSYGNPVSIKSYSSISDIPSRPRTSELFNKNIWIANIWRTITTINSSISIKML